ncbi:hypothetical protein DTO013E5_754 [Penicillium roqueforti]|uniref:Cystinosin/ERS1p repeat n=1 Tax=Penicillium roqueforti (strain FM164) TaxID=1365484 RepID=W6QDH5_PENRF|nr:uncharacterized protein LCP9604111_2556 [Penicillium roqueforti]CDM34116.1 Cystinosin/ERS1p repeat [Penicillium roqueforti FM164]KAF9251155.1 hypothetical protein LCP9604111_2556 [Penicillium roqueforti]KAI1837987.1 hypothetical protein CBS147337_1210 [Penicillium roqueforti]KAI2678677.1 hypothetical protein CBS147355_4562 [Penicillium roqueforti]KAI2705672.1 hypothetical protein CBS147372_1975 [Penicillium roqueforti]
MSPPLLQYLLSGTLPDHCEPTSPFLTAVSSHLHICIPTPLAAISSVLGTLSIVSWLFAQLPQIYKNYQVQSTSGLSIFFLVIWCLGDASNLVGALYTRQAGWQVVIASYYVFVDIALVFQFFWYTHYKPRQNDSYDDLSHSHDSARRNIIQGVPPPGHDSDNQTPAPVNMNNKHPEAKDGGFQAGSALDSTHVPTASYSNEKLSSSRRSVRLGSSMQSPPFALPRTMLMASLLCAVLANAAPTDKSDTFISEAPRETIVEIIGRVFSWMSTILYLGSRPPQLYKNYQRKSTEGLSPLLFMAAFCGNLFYSSSMLTNPNAWSDFSPYGGGGWADNHGNNRLEWIGRATPFFLGAFGVLGLDGFMGVQFLMYGDGPEHEDDESFISGDGDDPKRGRSRWRHVHGWMRGWIPSASPRRDSRESSVSQEGQALLGAERGRYGTV